MEYGYGNERTYEKPVKVDGEYDVTIDEVGVKGDGIARVQGFVVFVPNTKKGEKVKVRVTQVMRKFAIGEKVGAASAEAPAEAEISTEEAMEIVDDCIANGMVQCADNVQSEPWYMCNCCSCCCHLFRSMRKNTLEKTVVSSNYIAQVDTDTCIDCGKCIKRCPADSIDSNGSHVTINQSRCVGCGVCQTGCPKEAIKMNKRPKRIYTPKEYNEKVIAMSLERGRLADQLFFDPNKLSHRFMSRLINTILQLPPIKQLLAKENIQTKFARSIANWIKQDMQKTINKERIRLNE